MPNISLLLGYAVGTAQILLLEWYRRRLEHAKQLRILRAELRRLAAFTTRFGWKEASAPEDETIPNPPMVAPVFFDLVTATDFYLTDEYEDDNAQEAILGLADGCALLRHHHDKILDLLKQLDTAPDPERRTELRERVIHLTEYYDDHLGILLYTTKDALREIDRRIKVVRLWPQLKRLLGRLPKGSNPPPMGRKDPRLASPPQV